MRINITAVGSRGDVQPYIALGVGLQRAGHHVQMATHDVFEGAVLEQGLDFFPMSGDPRTMLETKVARTMLDAGRNPLSFVYHYSRLTRSYLSTFMERSMRACIGADVLVFSGTTLMTGVHIAEKLSVPFVAGVLQPATPTSAFENAFFPPCPRRLPFRGAYNRLTHLAFALLVKSFFGHAVNPVRRALGLTPMSHAEQVRRMGAPGGLVLYGISPTVIGMPADWPDFCHLTGYWFLDHAPGWQPTEALTSFLASGPPPVYVGFGSMKNEDPGATARLVIRALQLSGQRGVLLGGWGGLQPQDVPPTIIHVDAVPHDWLFPRMAAVVHHGGAGTTAAGLRAGVPSIVVPFFGDQPFWGHQVHRLGVGPAPLSRRTLTAARLARAIRRTVEDPAMRARAAELGAKISAEDGLARAVALIEAQYADRLLCAV